MALARFFERAGEAPKLLAFDDEMGCPLHHGLSALEWATAVGVLKDEDLIHGARLASETAAAVVERKIEGKRSYLYLGPRMDAPPASPYEGTVLYDEPGVRAYIFAQRAHAQAHFLRATGGVGSVLALLSRRAPELIHIKRWMGVLFAEVEQSSSSMLLAGWFATTGAGFLFAPAAQGEPYVYQEVGSEV